VDISRLLDTFGNRPATQRMVQATISAFFSFCEERYGIAHPCHHMKRRGGAREGERFLSDDELRRALPVMRELGYPRGDVMLFSLLTGRRLREVTDMTWSEVDLVARVHHLPASHSKNRKAHRASLRGRCRRVQGCGG
jgi:integrase